MNKKLNAKTRKAMRDAEKNTSSQVYENVDDFLKNVGIEQNAPKDKAAIKLFHSDRLSQIPGLVDVGASLNGDIIGEKLGGDAVGDRCELI